jgi:hypothetical protein
MVRNIGGFAIFAVLATVAFRLLVGLLGGLLSIVMTVLVWALIGFAIYTVLKIFFPGTAAKVKDTINGDGAA